MSGGAAGRPLWPPFVALAAGIVVADQLTKAWLVATLAPGESTSIVGDLLRLVYSQNNGGLFGLLRGQALPFAVLSIGVMGLIVLYHARSGRADPNAVTDAGSRAGDQGQVLDPGQRPGGELPPRWIGAFGL